MTNTETQNSGAPIDARTVWQSLCVLHEEHPAEELARAVACGKAIVPHLLETVRDADANPQKYIESEMADAPVFALLLLAQMRVKEAFPLVVGFFCRDDEHLDDLVGDGLTEYLPALLASTFDGRIGALVEMAIDQDNDDYVASAGMAAICSLVIAGVIERKAAITALIEIGTSLPKKSPVLWTDLAIITARLRAQELYPMVDRAFVEGKIPKEEISRADYEKLKKTEFTDGDDYDFRLINDVVEETSWWSVFSDEESDEPFDDEDDDDENDAGSEAAPEEPKAGVPYTNPNKTVGRNDLCPCGSGRKWKKCCGS